MKVDNSACVAYEQRFNEKINALSDHPKFQWLRQYSDRALNWHTGFGYLAIKAVDFMDRVIAKPVEYIRDWLDGKNKLEW